MTEETCDVAGDGDRAGGGVGARGGKATFSLTGECAAAGSGGVAERGEAMSSSEVVDFNEPCTELLTCPLLVLSLGERGVRLVVVKVGVTRPFEFERVVDGREEGVTLPELELCARRSVPLSLPGEAGRPGGLLVGGLELLFSHKEAAARTLLGPPVLDAEAVRALGAALRVEGRVGLMSTGLETTSPASDLLGDDMVRNAATRQRQWGTGVGALGRLVMERRGGRCCFALTQWIQES